MSEKRPGTIRAAAALMRSKSYANTSLDDIWRRQGLARASFINSGQSEIWGYP